MTYDPAFKSHLIEGVNRFQSARTRAFWEEMLALVRGKSAGLMSFEDIRTRLHLTEESYKGLQDIEIEKIVGSVGRYRDFTSSFLPRNGKMQERWSRVYAKVNSMEGVPPIEVYQVGEVYFVRDGNHRVSVAKQIKNKTIEAHVTELRTPIYLHANMSESELNEAEAYTLFLKETGLQTTRPHLQSLQLSEPSRYGEMMEYIYLHKSFMEDATGKSVTLREAAANWYDTMYRPALTLIRKYHVLAELPERSQNTRTEADLFMWLIDHLHDVRDEVGETAPNTYSSALSSFMSEQKMDVPEELMHEQNDVAPITQSQVMRQMSADVPSAGFSGDNTHMKKFSA